MRINLQTAIAKLQAGEIVAIPTETVYGLAADASNEEALRKIYAAKERPANNPLIVHISSIQQVSQFASEFSPLAQKFAHALWPGPFTLVLNAQAHVSNILRAGEPTVALRIPAHPLALELLQKSGLALAAPSANKYTQLSPTTAAHVEAGLGLNMPVLDGGACKVGIESTIVSVHGDHWQLLRLGMVSEQTLEALAGKPAMLTGTHAPKAPGQHLLHYSPRTPTLLFNTRTTLVEYAKTHDNCAALLIGTGASPACEHINLPLAPYVVAEQLYDTLHTLDHLKKVQLLLELPPLSPEWAAIQDRLTRAGFKS